MVDVDTRAPQERHACAGKQNPEEVLDATRSERRDEERAQELAVTATPSGTRSIDS